MLTRSASKRFREGGSDNARAVGSHQTFSDSEDSNQQNVSTFSDSEGSVLTKNVSIKLPLLLHRDAKILNDLPNEVIAEILFMLDFRSFLMKLCSSSLTGKINYIMNSSKSHMTKSQSAVCT